jgi:hypothetical protein
LTLPGLLAWAALGLSPPALTAAPKAPGLSARSARLLAASLDDYNRLDFKRSESEASQAMALQPLHPLPIIHLQGCLSAEIYEQAQAGDVEAPLLNRFQAVCEQASSAEEAWEGLHHDAWSQLYIGNSLGTQALVALYQGRSLGAYHLGQRADAALQLAQAREPRMADADLGLGQYRYYCGRMAGVLQFFLVLPGDIPGGMQRLRSCAASGCTSAILARLVLARIMVEDLPDPEAALPFVQEAIQRYPSNWTVAKFTMEEAQALGMERPEARKLARRLRRQWDSGWRPPAYAKMDVTPLFAALDAHKP